MGSSWDLPVSLGVCVGEDAGLKQLVLCVRDAWDNDGGAECNLIERKDERDGERVRDRED